MRATKLGLAVGALAVLTFSLAARTSAQETARKRPPIIRVYSENEADLVSTSTYVTPAFEVSENAYVFAVEMDLDGQIQVLHPDFPGISVKIQGRKQIRLPNFFAGFNQRGAGGYYSTASYLDYYDGAYDDSRGTVIALASRAPFNLEKIEVNGDWNMSTIRRLMNNRSPESAAQALAAYIGVPGEPIGRDYMRFAGGRRGYGNYASYAYDPCDAYYGYAFGPVMRAHAYSQINYLNARGIKFRVLGFDACGIPIIAGVNQGSGSGFPVGRPRPPVNSLDSGRIPKGRGPKEGMPRHPRDQADGVAEGVFPLPQRSGLPQLGDVTIQAPTGRRGEPRQILEGYRSGPGMAAPQGRAPIDPTISRPVPSAASGGQPVRDYHPEPRTQSPPPSRSPEPRTSSPPPVVHERPPAPSSPPPRTETTSSRGGGEPVRTPPPNRQ